MTRRPHRLAICALTVLACLAHAASASQCRMTPVVKAVKRARASVVNIHSVKTSYKGDALFTSEKGRKVNGMGTGVVVDERGYIVTNYHVIKDVDSLRCVLDDGSTYNADIVSFDRQKDLAIIKVQASRPLTVMPMGTSSDLMLGESVIAIGNAYGYEHSVTCGIVSYLSRDVEVNETQSYENLIQTDASINPGNSGGPLVNLDGEVIGINVAIRAGAQRIGFAIPIDDARKVVRKLLSIEQLDRNWHGLETSDVKAGARKSLLVRSTKPGSPALKAGFQRGDVILDVSGTPVVDGVDWERTLLGRKAGDKVEVTVRREDAEERLTLELDRVGTASVVTRNFSPIRRMEQTEPVIAGDRMWRDLGLKLSRQPQSKGSFAGTRYRGGMKVLDVRRSSPAAQNGIRPGDILVGLHIWETVNAENVNFVLDHPDYNKFSPLKFYILRGRETLYGHLKLVSSSR